MFPCDYTQTHTHTHNAVLMILLATGDSCRCLHSGVSHLLERCVFDSVRVIMIIDDLEVLHSVSFLPCGEVNLRCSLSCSLGVNGEVGGCGHLNTCTVILC